MNISKEVLGIRIRNIRITRKETLEEFAEQIRNSTNEKIKTTKSNVSKWEKGENVPNAITLHAISDLGGITVNELLYGKSVDPVVELLEQEIAKLVPTGDYSQGLIEGLNIAKEILIKNKNL